MEYFLSLKDLLLFLSDLTSKSTFFSTLLTSTHVTTTSTEEPIEYTWFATVLDNNTEQNATEIWGEGELSTVTEQVHSKKWGRSKKGEDSQEEVSTITDSSSVYED